MKVNTIKQQLLCDTQTPVSLFLALRDEFRFPLLLESSDYSSKNNHYSYLCFEPLASIQINDNELKTRIENEIDIKKIEKSLRVINHHYTTFLNSFDFDEAVDESVKGLFGYCAYNIIDFTHEITLKNKASEIPDLLYHLYSIVLIFNHATNEMIIYVNHFVKEKAELILEKVLDKIILHKHNTYPFAKQGEEISNCTDDEFKGIVTRAKEFCKLGEVFQLVVSRRFEQQFNGDDFNVYRALRKVNPSPYMFYFDVENFKLFGSSPEAQLKINNGIAEIHPIAGTYKRTGNDALDIENASKLLNDEKENSEHVMLVDLARNDLNKHAINVKVKSYKQIQFYSHVIHMVSNVTGELKAQFNSFEALTGTFPAGTLSGAPKHRAIELIDELENEAREFYGGTIGFVGQNKSLNQAIIIRSFLSKNNKLTYQAGAGVVINSDEENELNEVFNKIGVLRKAINEAAQLNNKM